MAFSRISKTAFMSACLAIAWPVPSHSRAKDEPLRIEVGPIWNQQDAKAKCDKAARKARGEWTGDWTTVVPGQSSVCMVRIAKGSSLRWPEPIRAGGSAAGSSARVEKTPAGKWTVEAGPIWADMDAQRKCPGAVAAVGGKWTGQWWTTQMGRMSVCEFTR